MEDCKEALIQAINLISDEETLVRLFKIVEQIIMQST